MADLEKTINDLERDRLLIYGLNLKSISDHIGDALELLKEQRWIPITDRLPKDKETVLLSDGYDVCYGYMTTKRDFVLVDEALSKDNYLIKSKKHWGISHWMPLPKIPKDGEQK